MDRRGYRLGQRQIAADRTAAAILAAGRDLVVSGLGPGLSVGAVAARAGVSRLTIYNRFGSKAGLLNAIAQSANRPRSSSESALDRAGDVRDKLHRRIAEACSSWAADPALFRQLPGPAGPDAGGQDHLLAERLAADDQLRPGCSIREAEDVIAVLTSFPTFDRLHKDGRRSVAAVAEIITRMAGAVLRQQDM